jgi:predicted DNA-binding transcriptional regulator YafY
VAIALGLQAAAHSPVAGIAEASVGALAKIVQVMPPRLRRRVDALRTATLSSGWRSGETPPGPVIDPTALTVIAQTCRDTVRLRFDYTAAGGERTEREVEPSRLVALGRRWYLVAYDITRHDWRSFRLDRLERPLATGVRFRPRELPAEDAAAFVRERLSQLPVAFEVVAHVRAPADDVRARIGAWAQVEPVEPQGADAAGTCVVRMSGDQLLWPAMALAATEAEFIVLQPASLRAYIAEAGGRFTRAAGDATGITGSG